MSGVPTTTFRATGTVKDMTGSTSPMTVSRSSRLTRRPVPCRARSVVAAGSDGCSLAGQYRLHQAPKGHRARRSSTPQGIALNGARRRCWQPTRTSSRRLRSRGSSRAQLCRVSRQDDGGSGDQGRCSGGPSGVMGEDRCQAPWCACAPDVGADARDPAGLVALPARQAHPGAVHFGRTVPGCLAASHGPGFRPRRRHRPWNPFLAPVTVVPAPVMRRQAGGPAWEKDGSIGFENRDVEGTL